MNHMKRHVSGPTLELLGQAGLAPEDVDSALQKLVWSKTSAILRKHDPLIARICDTTAIGVVQIARKSRYLLMEIEQRGDNGALWQYREQAPSKCIFSCVGQVPDLIESALNGELLEKLVIPAVAMAGMLISNIDETGDGWLNIDVVPPWHRF